MMQIDIFQNNRLPVKISKLGTKMFLITLANELKISLSKIALNFINSERMIEINSKFLNHNYDTDIITFVYNNDPFEIEIFISIDQALLNANKFKVDINSEILRLIIHGFLHSVGYDDGDKNSKRKMKMMENKLVKKYVNENINLLLSEKRK